MLGSLGAGWPIPPLDRGVTMWALQSPILGMAIQSESDPSPTQSEENNPIRVRGKGYPTPTPTSRSESELETDRSWTLLKIRHFDPTPTLKEIQL